MKTLRFAPARTAAALVKLAVHSPAIASLTVAAPAVAALALTAAPLRADAAAGSAEAFDELEFLVGGWSAEALGGTAQEIWLPAEGDVMHAVFRLVTDGGLKFSEFIQLTRENGEIVMRFEHFRPDYTTWEGEDPPMNLRLAESGERFVRFEGTDDRSPDMEYRLGDDGVLQVEVTGVPPFRFHRME